jgi:hypothetical protein
MASPITLAGTTVPTIFAIGAIVCLILGYDGQFPGLVLPGWFLVMITLTAFALELWGGGRENRKRHG